MIDIFGIPNCDKVKKTLEILQEGNVSYLFVDFKKKLPTKEQVLDWVSNEITGESFLWPRKTLKSGPRKGSEVLLVECYDMADAYVIARAGQISEHPVDCE